MAEVSSALVGLKTLGFATLAPPSPGHTTLELYFIAWATPDLFMFAAACLIGVAILLQLASAPLKRRWSDDLRGWIE